RAESDVQRRLEPMLRGLRGAHVRADRDVHADEARRSREDGPDQEADRSPPAELVVEAEQEERDDRDDRDRRVLTAQVGRRTLLNGATDLLHPLAAGRPPEQPGGQADPVGQRDRRADEGEENRVVTEEVDRYASLTKSRRESPAPRFFITATRFVRRGEPLRRGVLPAAA